MVENEIAVKSLTFVEQRKRHQNRLCRENVQCQK